MIVHNEDDLQKIIPGDRGTLSVSIKSVLDCPMDGDIQLHSDNESVFTIDESFHWEALKPGVAKLPIDIIYSEESLARLHNMYPHTLFISRSIASMLSVTVGSPVYRLYNPNSGEHFFTVNQEESTTLERIGWKSEGTGWISYPETTDPQQERPVYRLYNPNAGDHHYTLNKGEADYLVRVGWKNEGIAAWDNPDRSQPVYRLYNPNAKSGAHHFTTNETERDMLIELGWNDEGIAWHAL